jgi:hypothetical protein
LLGAVFIPTPLGLVWLETITGAGATDVAAAHALGAFLF